MIRRWFPITFVVASLAGLSTATVVAQQTFVYPAKGQSAKQQQKDESECHTWAIQQTGYNPANPTQAPAAAAPAGPAAGSGARGAARGAVVGGAINGGDGAAGGAAVGAVAARSRSRNEQQQQANANQSAANAAGPQAYNRARTACLSGRGYNVN